MDLPRQMIACIEQAIVLTARLKLKSVHEKIFFAVSWTSSGRCRISSVIANDEYEGTFVNLWWDPQGHGEDEVVRRRNGFGPGPRFPCLR